MQGKNYKDRALAMLFLMNNLHYVVKAVESSPALSLVGQDWVEEHKDQVGSLQKHVQKQWGPNTSDSATCYPCNVPSDNLRVFVYAIVCWPLQDF